MKTPTAEELNKLIEAGWRFDGDRELLTLRPTQDNRTNWAAEWKLFAFLIPHWWPRDPVFEE